MKQPVLLTFLMLVINIASPAQEANLVEDQGITSSLHEANKGRIRFLARDTPLADLREADFVSTYVLTNKSNLYMTAFMAKSLTNAMHRLAPELNAATLVSLGTYQFSFFVDDSLVYQSNLHPGAPFPEIKNTETVIRKPLIDNQREGRWWSQSLWYRFMNNGGDSVLTEGRHTLKIEIRPYIKNPGVKTGAVMAAGELALDVRRKPVIDLASVHLNKPVPYGGWQVSSEKFDAGKMKGLKGNIREGVFKNITSVVVIKNDRILIEEYFNGAGRDSLHDPRSVGKSFASTIAGIAIHEGFIKDENQALGEFYDLKKFDNYSPEKENTRISDLLTMSSAFNGNDNDGSSPGNEENMYPTDDWVKFTLDLPVDTAKPKGEWNYFTAGVVVLGDILDKAVPGGLEKYAHEKLFKPLGIAAYKWQYTPQKVANTAGGIRMNALDFAKYGQLYQNEGRWRGKQVIPKTWITKTFKRHKTIPGRTGEFYGYLFWNKKYMVQGKELETFYCAGNGGNKIFIFRDQPLVIVVTATAYNTPYAHSQVDRMMSEYILPAVLSKP